MIIKYWTRAFSKDRELHIIEDYVTGEVEFKEDGVHFASFGHRYMVAYDKVVSIRKKEGEENA